MKERELQRKLVELLHEFKWHTMHVRPVLDANSGQWTTTTSAKGWPDVVALRGIFVLAIEVKGERGKPTTQQLDWLARFAALPTGMAWVVWPSSDLDRLAQLMAYPDEDGRRIGWSAGYPVQRAML